MLREIRWEFIDFIWLVSWQHVHPLLPRQCAQKMTIVLSNAAATTECVRHQSKPVELISPPLGRLCNLPLSLTTVAVNTLQVGIPIWSERLQRGSEPCSALRPQRDRRSKSFDYHLTTQSLDQEIEIQAARASSRSSAANLPEHGSYHAAS
jgi:hypothetical protein